ncbi:MAG: META domain-containing protein [Desulfobacter sp.]|nr:META domain-containing protein [Desulfobacter sp.]WDP87054.1 MAG: META domain-containing protein [Desulfobacter sp.]
MNRKRRHAWSAKIVVLTIAAVIALAGIGCTLADKNTKETRVRITSKNFKKISGVQWVLRQMIENGKTVDLKGEEPAFVQFQLDGKLSGFASVNRFFGQLDIDEKGRLEFSKFGSTRMAGPEELMDQEDRFLEIFQKSNRIFF